MNIVSVDNDCVFCRELAGSQNTNFARRYPELPGRIVGQTDSLVAFPCIGQILPGHFLIVPRSHTATMYDALAKNGAIREELDYLLRQVHGKLDVPEAASLMFEHGAKGPEDGGCGIYHAHLHVVPGAAAIDPLDVFDFAQSAYRSDRPYAHQCQSHDGSYVVVGTTERGFYHQRLENPLPSQSLRRRVAALLKVANWDWRAAGREATLISMVEGAR